MYLVYVILHIIFGLSGAGQSRVTAKFLEKRNIQKAIKFAKSAFIMYILSWIFGGATYLTGYKDLKTQIKAGSHSWIHSIIMETKEHIFLFIPFIAILLLIVIYYMKNNSKEEDWIPARKLAQLAMILGGLMAVLGFGVYLGRIVS